MGWFSKPEKWEETFRISPIHRVSHGFCSAIFWLWGIGGLLFIGFEFKSMPTGVGVGTSAYVTAQSMYWLGGMILFGLGALIDPRPFSGVRPLAIDTSGDVRITK
jgi:hypothetical protein